MKQAVTVIGLCGLMLLTACAARVPGHEPLAQAPAREVAASLHLPAAWEPGPVVPGLAQGAVPQGLARHPASGLVLTSHYFTDGRPSALVALDWARGAAIGTFYLQAPDGSAHRGHVGGIAADADSLWIASDAYLYRGDIADILGNPAAGSFRTRQRFATEATHEVAFCTVYDGQVWAGEFAHGDRYPTDPSHHLTARDGSVRHGWVSAYDPATGFDRPRRVLSVPDHAQGMVATEDTIYLSVSYGRRSRSAVEVYRNPLAGPPHRMARTSKGAEVPLWFLDGDNRVRTIDLPPQSQNVILIDGQLAVLFESGAARYRLFGGKPLDRIVLLPPTGLP